MVKNKIAPPFKEAEFDIMFGKGISTEGDILDLAASVNIVNKSGAWYAYNGEKIGQGRENAKTYLKERPEICQEIEKKVRIHFGLEEDPSSPMENLVLENGKEEEKEETKGQTKGRGKTIKEEKAEK